MSKEGIEKRVGEHMIANDRFSELLGIELLEIGAGSCRLSMVVKPEMLNGFGVIHGGATFTLADSALAFACNSHGQLSMALETSISFPVSVKVGDVLTATANEASLKNKLAIYNIDVKNQDDVLVASFKGTVYRTSRDYFEVVGHL